MHCVNFFKILSHNANVLEIWGEIERVRHTTMACFDKFNFFLCFRMLCEHHVLSNTHAHNKKRKQPRLTCMTFHADIVGINRIRIEKKETEPTRQSIVHELINIFISTNQQMFCHITYLCTVGFSRHTDTHTRTVVFFIHF